MSEDEGEGNSTEPKPEPNAEPEPGAEPEPDAKPEPNAEPEPEPNAEPEPAEPEPEPGATAEPALAPLAPPEPDAPAELIIDAKPPPGDASDGSGMSAGRIAVPIGGAALLAKFVSPTAGVIGLAAAVAYLFLNRAPKEPRMVLRIIDRDLAVAREGAPDPHTRLPLTDVQDVTIDRSGAQPQKERVRVAIERKDAPPVLIPEQPITALEAQEWFFRIRVFLRKQGWLPKDERNNPIDPSPPAN